MSFIDNPDVLISRNSTLEIQSETNDELSLHSINEKIFENKKTVQTKPTRFFALGGLGEVGKNTYCLEHDDELIIIDAGIKFLNKKVYPGITGSVAGLDYLKANESKIKGLYITHGHEDHIGGIPHMLKQINIPVIYAPVLAAELIKKKLKEHNLTRQKIELFARKSIFRTQHFVIDFFKVNHSIPDAYGICVVSPNGVIVSSGDFRFDFGSKSDKFDLQKVQQISARKVDLLLCESTNAEQPGFNESEKVVISELNNIISSSPGRVIVTFFASNLARIEEIIKIAISCNRKIALIGRSIENSIDASQRIGYLKLNKKIFIPTSAVQNLPDNEVLIICTGSQGEENAVLSNMSKNKHHWIKLKSSDNIIFSSNVIPGNSSAVDEVVNRLYKSGCNIFINSPSLKIHSSGHASKLEQQLFVNLINPNFIVPIHGETRMLKELKRNCLELGFSEKHIFILENGHVVQLLNGVVSVTEDKFNTEPLYVVGNDLTRSGLKILKKREKLGQDGVLLQHIYLDLSKKVIHVVSPITNVGSFFLAETINFLKKINLLIQDKVKDLLKVPGTTTADISSSCVEIWKSKILAEKKQKPAVRVFVTDVSKEKLAEDSIYPKVLEIKPDPNEIKEPDESENVDNAEESETPDV